MRDLTLAHRLRLRNEMQAMLARRSFNHFVTLATHDSALSYPRARSLLKRWDARVNRQLNQANWAQRPDERTFWFAFPEKLATNPHWHLLVQLDPGATGDRLRRQDDFPEIVEHSWKTLIPSGTTDCQAPYSTGVLSYATKVLYLFENYEGMVVSREFQTDP